MSGVKNVENMLKSRKGVVLVDDEKKPFNDYLDHLNKIEGNVPNGSLKGLPKGLRYIGFFAIGFFLLTFLLILILNILNI
jgi:hypothetical protein